MHHRTTTPAASGSTGRATTAIHRAGRPLRLTALALGATVALAGCSVAAPDQSPETSTSTASSTSSTASTSGPARCSADNATVTLVTHDSFVMSKQQRAAFTKASGCTLKIVQSGDAGALTNRLVLTRNSPLGDAVFGIDNAFAGRALKENVLATNPAGAITLPRGAQEHALEGEGADRLTPIDYGDVCVNIDDRWFATHEVARPRTLADLTRPMYKDLFVTPGATTSSPGLAFLLATIGDRGENGWQDYWRRLMANGTKVTSGWTDAYLVDFTAGGGSGTRPIVLSYASSIPFTVDKATGRPTTSALLDTCFRQVEYAGVLTGAGNPEGARALVDYLLTDEFQAGIPESMYVYPVSSAVELPQDWARWAKVAPKPITVDPETIEANRDTWLREWSDITS